MQREQLMTELAEALQDARDFIAEDLRLHEGRDDGIDLSFHEGTLNRLDMVLEMAKQQGVTMTAPTPAAHTPPS